MEDLSNTAIAPEATTNTRSAPPSVASIVINASSHGGGFAPEIEKSKKYPIEVTIDLNNSLRLPVDLLTVFLTFAWDPDIRPNPGNKVISMVKYIHGKRHNKIKLFDEVEFKNLDPQIDYHMEMGTVVFLANDPLNISTNYVQIKWKS